MSPPVGSSPSFGAPLPQRTGATTGANGQEKQVSLHSVVFAEIGDMFAVKPPEKEVIKHKTDDYSDYFAALGYDA